ncbi:hypothetical protein FRB91_005572 [Serendipita sp. 411]|nr:hypothetical protein FRB91_005572 [Serendipita sp. 411]
MKDERRVYEDLPKKELDDYWATRPKYETFQAFAASSSSNNQSELPYLSGGGESSSAGSSSVTNTGGGSVSAPKKAEPERKTPMRSQTGAWGALMDDEEGAPPPYTLEADEMPASPVSVVPAPSSTAAATTSAPSTTNTATTAPSIAPSVTSPTPSSTTGTPASSTHGVGVHRTSSYAAPSSNPNQGATGLGRATTYTPTSSQTTNTQSVSTPTSARPLFAPPSFAPPSTAPPRPNSASAHHRPPIHPASSLAGSSTPPTQSPYKGPGSLPMHPGMSPNPSATNVTHHLANMSIGSSGHNTYTNPNPANIPSHPTGPNPAGGYHPTLVGSATGSMPSTPGAGPNYPPASTATPHGPTGGFVVPTPTQQNATSPWGGQAQPNSYMSAGQGLPFGGGGSTPGGVQPAGVGHSQSPAHPWNPPSSGPTQQQEWINPLAGSSSATAGSYPPAHGFTSPVPGAVTPIGQPTTYPGQPSSYPTSSGAETPSSYPLPGGGPTTSSYPGVAANSSQGWTSAYPAPGSYPPPGVGPITGVNPPTLPPRPPQGQPGGSQNQTLLGGIVKQATGIVDRVAGESTRIQIEKGVISAAQTGSKLLGKLTK